MNISIRLNQKLKGTSMLIKGIGGIILNESIGAIHDEPQTTYEMNQLPRGYIIKGFGAIIGNKKMINKGRNYINDYRLKQKIKQEIFESKK